MKIIIFTTKKNNFPNKIPGYITKFGPEIPGVHFTHKLIKCSLRMKFTNQKKIHSFFLFINKKNFFLQIWYTV